MSGTPLRSYRPGTWFGLVGPRALVALPPSEKARVPALWELVDEGAGFDVTLDALISAGLRDLPGFVLVSTEDDQTDVVIRGPAVATFTVRGEEVVVEGSSATTWVERVLQHVERIRIELESGDDESAPSYFVDAGLFRVSHLEESRQDLESGRPVRALHVVESPAPPASGDVFALAPVPEVPTPEEPDLEEADSEEASVEEEAGDEEPEDESPIWAPVEESAEVPVRSPEPPAWTPAPPDDHDGLTLTGPPLPPPPPPPGISGQQPAPDVTKVVARLVISSGQTVDIDRATVIGRAPESKHYAGDDAPRLVTVPSAHYEISSTHIEVRPGTGADHGTAVITDLGSTNGTVVVQPGLGPTDLAPGEPVQLLPGALIDIGDGITIQVTRPEQ
ncbi:FHA domain-containing protein [Nocardioides dilutus]